MMAAPRKLGRIIPGLPVGSPPELLIFVDVLVYLIFCNMGILKYLKAAVSSPNLITGLI